MSPMKTVSHFLTSKLPYQNKSGGTSVLHYASSHPEHTKRSVVFSQTLRINRLCNEENDFKNYRSQMRS